MTIDVQVRPIGADSMMVTIAQQVERLKVDPAGRILGGVIVGPNLEFGDSDPTRPRMDSPFRFAIPPSRRNRTTRRRRRTVHGRRGSRDRTRGITLGGTLTMPTNARPPFPAVVTITGSGQQDRDEFIPFAGGIRLFRQVADTLSRRGIAVLRLDDRGVGASGGSRLDRARAPTSRTTFAPRSRTCARERKSTATGSGSSGTAKAARSRR